jgi:hypothetical protein
LTHFAHAVREELWSRGRLLESRLSHGEARQDADGIIATDARDDTFVANAEREIHRLRVAMPEGFTVRLVAESGTKGTTATMTVRDGPLSIVTDPAHLKEDLALLQSAASGARSAGFQPAAPLASSRPFLWQNGTAAILLHELLGHPLEHHLEPIPLPPWLHADIPLAPRRATFRDVPLLRMQHVHVSQQDAPFVVTGAVEIALVDGGAYDALTDTVTIHVAASSIGPFTIQEPRTRFAFIGARGEPIRYPGVICSREGQELVVGSAAPLLLTELR